MHSEPYGNAQYSSLPREVQYMEYSEEKQHVRFPVCCCIEFQRQRLCIAVAARAKRKTREKGVKTA